jgi:hypothetical protein
MQIGRLKARLIRSKTEHILKIIIPVTVGDVHGPCESTACVKDANRTGILSVLHWGGTYSTLLCSGSE